MKILVPIKRVIDYNVVIQVKSDQTGVETERVKMSMNPFDEIACEEAIRLKEAGHASYIQALTIGPSVAEDVLRQALAMGADEALHITTDQTLESLDIAQIIASEAKLSSTNLILMGKQAIDDDYHQTGEMCAAILGWPQVSQASKIIINGDQRIVTREVDRGLETCAFNNNGVITTDLRCNKPRYISLPNLMKARGKKIHKKDLGETGIEIKKRLKILRVSEPPIRTGQPPFDKLDDFMNACIDKGIL